MMYCDTSGSYIEVIITQEGPGVVYIEMRLPLGITLFVAETVTPLAPLQQRVRHTVWGPPHVPGCLPKFVLMYANAP